MAKLRTVINLQECLDRDFAWRVKEIDGLKTLLRMPGDTNQSLLIRATLPLVYAHWEGFVKRASVSYLAFVKNQRLVYRDLSDCFMAIGAKNVLNELTLSNKMLLNLSVVDFFINKLDDRVSFHPKKAINTESNLSSTVFDNIANSIGIDTSHYQAYYKLIDESLLHRRNRIAHGDYLDVNASQLRQLADEVLDLIRKFKTDIETAASLKQYMRTS